MNSITNLNDITTDWSFIICTDGINNIPFHEIIVQSILNQSIKNFEIIFVTENSYTPPLHLYKNIITIVAPSNKSKHITYKKNIGARCARYENLCILHDYLFLAPNWYESMSQFKELWNVCSFRILNSNGIRFSDWVVYNYPEYGHVMATYDSPVTPYHYVPGLAFCVKKSLILEYPLNEELTWGEAEDIEWSNRIKNTWLYKLNVNTYVQSLKLK